METEEQRNATRISLDGPLPEPAEFDPDIRRAPDRGFRLTPAQTKQALKNALRYVPREFHETLAPEFLAELKSLGRIYAYRYRPAGRIYGKPIDSYNGKCLAGKAFQVMIDNNLDFDVALYPYELVTYGETGQVCQNWLQYRLIKKYLEALTDEQTLVLESGHPVGLFPSKPDAPRVILTNALMVGLFDNPDDWEIAEQMGVANYGQMTAGGWMYIGPQGIVHGTFNTILGVGRKYLGVPPEGDLSGRVFVSSGLGGMSGAQPKAANIAHAVGVFAEVDASRIQTRLDQGWVNVVSDDRNEVFSLANRYRAKRESISIAYHGNIVDLLEAAVAQNFTVDMLSDQTSCHNAYNGGYCPVGMTFEERTALLHHDREAFRKNVNASLRRHLIAIQALVARGTRFFDYGNSFLKAVFDAGVTEISRNGTDTKDGFLFPSYVEDVMGPLFFDYGYGPFRWVCLSGKHEDLVKTDRAALECIDPDHSWQDRDNSIWIRDAEANRLVVGTQARILYQDEQGRRRIALRFNELVRRGEIGPVMLGRDHHDVSGTDSPFRETANIRDGSNVMADMAVQCFAGNAARGMTLCALHNGGGVGIGKAINGGFGLLLDGSAKTDAVIESAIMWDVIGGVARRSWAGNAGALDTAARYNIREGENAHITLPYLADDALLDRVVRTEQA
ncbi:MAG: urocanate hydratase [Eubacteriales bacterium]|nr:urocanate hydratase [Eubacteriales bacterium]